MSRIVLCLYCCIAFTGWLCSQSVTTEFGKNRIQFHDDFDQWDMYETENFVTYWYGKGREIAHTVVQMAELDNPSIQQVLEHKMNDKIELIVYIDLTDLKQSNLGLEEQFVNRSGITKVVENKVFLYFNGDHLALHKSLREGIASVYINSMLHGNNLQEIVQNAVLLNLPDWFQEGLVSYVGERWNPELDSRLMDYFTYPNKRKKDFARLAKLEPRLAGHAMWYFISDTYGPTAISNILYLTRINRNLDVGLQYMFGFDLRELYNQCQAYYEKRYARDPVEGLAAQNDLILSPPRKNIPIGRMRFSPDGKTLAYTLNDHGRRRVILYDMATEERRVIYRKGIRNYEQEADINYPLIAWSHDGQQLAVIDEKRDVLHSMLYDFSDNSILTDEISPEYHRIYDLDYWSADTLLFAASTDGFSDLYLYTHVTRQSTRITHDFYDDLDASVVHWDQQRLIVFSSNRPDERLGKMELDTELPIGHFDLFLLDYKQANDQVLRQITHTPMMHERKARATGEGSIICLSNVRGRWQRLHIERATEDPPVVRTLAPYDRDIKLHEYVPGADVVVDWFQKYNQTIIQAKPLSLSSGHTLSPSAHEPDSPVSVLPAEKPEKEKKKEIDPRYLFQTPFPVPTKIIVTPLEQDTALQRLLPDAITQSDTPFNPVQVKSTKPLTPFIRSRIIAARLRFKLDYFNTTMDNELLFGGLDSYAGTKREFEPSPLGLLIKGSIKDLFEDYTLTGGARYPTTFNGSEYFLVFDNRKRRIDKQYALYRKSISDVTNDPNGPLERLQYVSVLGLAKWTYPFDVYNSIRAGVTIRNDREITMATDRASLGRKTNDAQRIGAKLEWVYDNTRVLDLNARLGTRAKVGVEVVKRFDLNLFEEGKKLQFNKGIMTVIGLDARHYVSPDQRTIFAARITAATSLGSERILYYLGGVENWLFASFDQSVGVPGDIPFAYTTIAANMRGFKYNARNGSSVALANAEVRIPVLQYLSRQKIRSSFLRNIQLVGFLDAGTAWHGPDPFSPQNPLNTVVLNNPPTVQVTVNYYRNPLVIGYGLGARTMLFGYFAKLDYGWNWETGTSRKPILHFSMGADF